MATQIHLTEPEKEVFSLFLKTVEHYGMKTTVRAAGGWVRDKVLGKESDDIDIAVDDQSGEDFANKVRTYVLEHSNIPTKVSRIGVVKANPEQSKHLATACLSIQGISFDLNNLRSETYTQDSRIPEITVGTALQDAQRRDFCVNAMFYNLNEGCIEDLCQGLEDLEKKILRTPLDPMETFADDPLRVLRAVRFAARLNFELDTAIVAAAKLEQVQASLLNKVSRERVGVEVEKMMKNPHALRAVELIADLNLADVTFQSSVLTQTLWLEEGLRTFRALRNVNSSSSRFAALFIALADDTYLEKKKPKSVVHGIVRENLKLSIAEAENAATMAKAARRLRADNKNNIEVAEILCMVKDSYLDAVNIAAAYHGEDYEPFQRWLDDSGLVGCWAWRPMFNGRELMEWGVPKGKDSPLADLLKKQLEWRYIDPNIDSEEVKRRILDAVKGVSDGNA